MQHLHAYWRQNYVEAPKRPEQGGKNPFVEIPNNPDEKAARLIYRGAHNYLVMNIFPYNAGHLLAVPYREVPSLEAMTQAERADLMELTLKAQQILTRALKPDGFNIGMNLGSAAGAGIPQHVHMHIVPRWQGDTNFMPVLAETKTLTQSLDTMWERLRACLD
ncbi:MAG: HIT family hydrolase [Verrucomicrobia bacterium 21-51-4]|nr:MAG: HIT family hydrolase [Verrucomicrobia bacterium 21-51-4]HQU08767.1 HIT domain-containing protein [Opitutales bacterium]